MQSGAASLHVRSAHMQSGAAQVHRTALCITRQEPRGGTGATRQAPRSQAGREERCKGGVRPAAAPLVMNPGYLRTFS
jgi:hypothetical protein